MPAHSGMVARWSGAGKWRMPRSMMRRQNGPSKRWRCERPGAAAGGFGSMALRLWGKRGPDDKLRAPAMTDLDRIWIDAAARLGIAVRRTGRSQGDVDAYVHYDGRTLHLAADAELDADDTVAQLVFHELCHALVQGPAAFRAPDWGLDNTSDRDAERERAAVRLQAHLAGLHGLRGMFFP